MSFFEFPHTRTYDSDLGWLISKYPEIAENAAKAAASEEAAKASEEAASASASAAAASAESAAASAESSADSAETSYNRASAAVSALEARFSQAVEQVSAADGEVVDARVTYNGAIMNTLGDAVRSQALREDLARTYGSIGAATTGTYANNVNWPNHAIALIRNEQIKNANRVTGFDVYIMSLHTDNKADVTIGLCTISGTTMTVTHAVSKTFTSTGAQHIPAQFVLNPSLTYYVFIRGNVGSFGFRAVNAEADYFSATINGAISRGTSATISTSTGAGIMFAACEIAYNNNLVVPVSKIGKYKTINAAVNYIRSTDYDSATVLIYPGTYDEHIDLGLDSHITLRGVDREKTIIRMSTGKFLDAPIVGAGDFAVENLTVIMNHDNAGAWYPTWDFATSGFDSFAGYCIHIDEGPNTSGSVTTSRVRNCNLYSECNHAIGMGTWNNQRIIVEGCYIERNVTDERYLYWEYEGALGIHSQVSAGIEVNETCWLINNIVINNHPYSMQLFHYHNDSPMKVMAIRNTVKDSNGTQNTIDFRGTTQKANIIDVLSNHNNDTQLNY